MKKDRLIVVDFDADTSANKVILQPENADSAPSFTDYTKISVQVEWSGLTAAGSIDGSLQMQQRNSSTGSWDNLVGLSQSITQAAESVTFELTSYQGAYLRLAYTATDITAGTIKVGVIAAN